MVTGFNNYQAKLITYDYIHMHDDRYDTQHLNNALGNPVQQVMMGRSESHVCATQWEHDDVMRNPVCITGPFCSNQPVNDSPHKEAIMPKFVVSFAVSLNKLLNKQSSYLWMKTPCHSFKSL